MAKKLSSLYDCIITNGRVVKVTPLLTEKGLIIVCRLSTLKYLVPLMNFKLLTEQKDTKLLPIVNVDINLHSMCTSPFNRLGVSIIVLFSTCLAGPSTSKSNRIAMGWWKN